MQVVDRFNMAGSAALLLICEHASAYIPPEFQNLGLSNELLGSHIALDIGALDLARKLSLRLDAPLIASGVSRLVYDCNRPCGAADCIPEVSEVHPIPGNQSLHNSEVKERFVHYYLPFEKAIDDALGAFEIVPMVITVHSFTPVYNGRSRELDIGVICNGEERIARTLVEFVAEQTPFSSGLNQPYTPADGVTHTLDLHANKAGLMNAMIEVNNRLLQSDVDQERMADSLAPLISQAANHVGYNIPMREDYERRH